MNTAPASSLPLVEQAEGKFHTTQILQISSAHLVNDVYTGFVPTLYPVLMEKLSFSLTMVGTLNAIFQLPAILNPLIGFFADRASLQYLVILTPAITGSIISLLGQANGTLTLALLLFICGISVACFHAPAPAMIARIAGRKIGLGMSLFMASGELARTLGPLVAVWAVSAWTLEGMYRLVVIGWLTTLILFLQLRKVSSRTRSRFDLKPALPVIRRLFLPLSLLNFFRLFPFVCLTSYLPTFLKLEGAELWMAGGALSILELAGVVGALSSGTLSDVIGRKAVLIGSITATTLLMLAFLNSQGWLVVPVLLLLGFTTLSTTPVMLAIVQEQLPDYRGVANGLFMVVSFLLNAMVSFLIGLAGDYLGLRQVFQWSILFSLASLPFILFLPASSKTQVGAIQPH